MARQSAYKKREFTWEQTLKLKEVYDDKIDLNALKRSWKARSGPE